MFNLKNLFKSSKNKEQWDSRFGFILACIGSAVGLSNVWRFPVQVLNNGGAIFLIPYLFALIFIGIPMLLLELTIGEKFKQNCLISIKSINNRLTGIGLIVLFNVFLIVSYYIAILSVFLLYLLESFKNPLPWSSDAQDYFDQKVSIMNTNDPKFQIKGNLLLCLISLWICVYFLCVNGLRRVETFLKLIMPLALILILVMLITSSTLPGASTGIKEYIGNWEFEKLKNFKIWTDAITQVFFSSSVTLGVMIVYSSSASKFQNSVQDSIIIIFANALTEFLAGFAVFAIKGYLINQKSGTKYNFGGPNLAFITYPAALSNIKGSNVFSFLFFFSMLLLGMSSLVGLIQTISSIVLSFDKFKSKSKPFIILITCLLCFILSIFYITDNGLIILDVVDNFCNNIIMLFIAIIETISIGWIYKDDIIKKELGHNWFYLIYFGLFSSIISSYIIAKSYYLYIGIISGISLFVFIFIIVFIISKLHSKSKDLKNSTILNYLILGNVEIFRSELNIQYINNKKWSIPFIWSILIRWILPIIFLILFINSFDTILISNFKETNYIGLIMISISFILGIFYLIFPQFSKSWISEDKESDNSILNSFDNNTANSSDGNTANSSSDEIISKEFK